MITKTLRVFLLILTGILISGVFFHLLYLNKFVQISNKNSPEIAHLLPGIVKITANMRPTDFVQEFIYEMPNVQWSKGTGFFVSDQAHIVTNYHVVAGAYDIWITLSNQKMVRAKLINFDELFDIAILKPLVDVDVPVILKWADSSKLKLGDSLIAIGSPLGLGFSVSKGIVSNVKRHVISPFFYVIQTDASINEGNSGGPVLNENLQVVGIAIAIASKTGGSDGLGFVIPSNTAKSKIDALINNTSNQTRFVGLTIEQNWKFSSNTIELGGVRVLQVMPESIMHMHGIKAGDILVAIDDNYTKSVAEFLTLLYQKKSSQIKLTIERDNTTLSFWIDWGH